MKLAVMGGTGARSPLLTVTNPAGLVVQTLIAHFPNLKIVGICDTPIRRRSL